MMLPFDINVEEESPLKNSLSSSGTSLARPPPAHSNSTPHPSSSSMLSSSLPPPGNETSSSALPDWSNMTAASFTSHCFISRNEFLGLNSSANFKEELSRLAEAFSAFNCAELLASVVKQNICDALCSRSLIIELFRYIALRTLIKGNTNSQVLAVPFIIDTVFQLLLRYPRSYYDLCAALLRTPNEVVEYTPFGLDNHTFQSRYSATLASYLHVFGAIPPRLFWPPPTTQQSYYKGRPLLNSRFSTPPPLYTPMILFNLNDANAKAAFSAPLLRVAQAIQAYDCGELRAYVIQESHCANLDFFSVMLEVFRYLALTALDMDFENLVPPYSVAKIWSIMLLFPQSYHALALRIFPDRRHIDPPAVYFKRGDESDEDLKAKYRCTLGKYLSLFYCRPSILMWPTLPLSLVKGLPAIDPPVPSSALSYSSKQPDGPNSSSSAPNSSLPMSSTSLPAPAMVKFIIRDLKGVDASMSILPTSSLRRAFTIYAEKVKLKVEDLIFTLFERVLPCDETPLVNHIRADNVVFVSDRPKPNVQRAPQFAPPSIPQRSVVPTPPALAIPVAANVNSGNPIPGKMTTSASDSRVDWELYVKRAKKLVEELSTKKMMLKRCVLRDRDLLSYQIFCIKRRIREILAAIASHHAMDTRHPSLGELKGDGKEGDDDGVDVLEITCSKCGGMDTENNDILLCDKKGCCRAYHQKCQSPEVKKAELAAAGDWFCRECETMDRCMAMLQVKGDSDWSKVYPEVLSEASLWKEKVPLEAYDPEGIINRPVSSFTSPTGVAAPNKHAGMPNTTTITTTAAGVGSASTTAAIDLTDEDDGVPAQSSNTTNAEVPNEVTHAVTDVPDPPVSSSTGQHGGSVAAICLAVEASTQKISSDAHNKRECEERKEDPRPLSIVHGDSLQSLGKRSRPSLNDVETIKYNNDEEYDGKGAKMRSMEDSRPSVLPSTGDETNKKTEKPAAIFSRSPSLYPHTPPPPSEKETALSSSRHLTSSSSVIQRSPNRISSTNTTLSNWKLYESRIRRLLELYNTLSSQDCGVHVTNGGSDLQQKRGMIMFSIKRRIREILAAIASHHAMDTRHPSLGELKGDGKEVDDGGVDVLEITCSKCGGMDTENNDILLCDKKGCCRAYHQKCQSPEVKKAELAAAGDWFCRECETMDRCMAMIAGSKLRDVSKTSLSSEEAACEAAGTAQQWEDEFDPESLQGLVIVHEMMRHASPMQQRSAGRPRKERPPSDDSILASKQHLHRSSPSSPPPLSVNTEKERECMETIDLRVRTVATVGKNGANKNGVVLVFRVKQDMPIQRILEAYAARRRVNVEHLRFQVNGAPLLPELTPRLAKLHDGDVIDAIY